MNPDFKLACCKRNETWYVYDENIWRKATNIEKQFLDSNFGPINKVMENAVQQILNISFNMSAKAQPKPYTKQKWTQKDKQDLQ